MRTSIPASMAFFQKRRDRSSAKGGLKSIGNSRKAQLL
jgi:hypothetical protein